jgi:hypothetical protein
MTNQPQQDPSKSPGEKNTTNLLMIIVGFVLLLPGLCAAAMSFGSGTGGYLIAMGMAGLAISAGGVWLIVAGLRIGSNPSKQ